MPYCSILFMFDPPPDPEPIDDGSNPLPIHRGAEKRPIPRAPEPEPALSRRSHEELVRTAQLFGVSTWDRKAGLVRAIGHRLRDARALGEALALLADETSIRLLAAIVLEGRVALDALPRNAASELLLYTGLIFVGRGKNRALAYVPEDVRGSYARALIPLLGHRDRETGAGLRQTLWAFAEKRPPPKAPFAPGLPTPRAQKRLATPGPDRVLELDVRLEDVGMPVWRRLLVSYQRPLGALHQIIQVAFGWADRGPHWFARPTTCQCWADPRRRIDGKALPDEWQTPIRSALATPGARVLYAFDTGVDWKHEILTRCVHAPDLVEGEPRVIAAEARCPPVDLGQPRAYGSIVDNRRTNQ